MKKEFQSYYLLMLLMLCAFAPNMASAQCDANNIIVAVAPGTCPSNGSIVVTLPGGPPCTGWQAILTNPGGLETIRNVPNSGGPVIFGSLAPGEYGVRLVNGGTVLQYSGNPVSMTTSYVPMTISSSSTAPSCPSTGNLATADGSLDITIDSGGTGPFIFEVNSNFGTQTIGPTFTTSNTFGNMEGGEAVTFTVTDTNCGVSLTQNPVIAENNERPSDYGRSVFQRNCSPNCSSYTPTFSTFVFSASRISTIQLPGNATISINGGAPQNLTVEAVAGTSVIFTYPPGIGGNVDYQLSFNDGCFTFGENGTTLPIDDNRLQLDRAFSFDPNTCAPIHQVDAISVDNVGEDAYLMFCPTNNIAIEQEIAPGVWNNVPLVGGIANPLNSQSFSQYYTLPSAGRFRIIASDDCHTVIEAFNTLPESNPLDDINVRTSTSILEGTGTLLIDRDSDLTSNAPIPSTTYEISPIPFVSSLSIDAAHPFSLAGTYTYNFPIQYTTAVNRSFIGDLPPGEYQIRATDVCGNASTTTQIITTTAAYDPDIQALPGCGNSAAIQYNLNTAGVSRSDPFTGNVGVEIWTDDGSGGLGSLVQGDLPPNGYSGVFENLAEGDYLLRFTRINFQSDNSEEVFSAATLSNSDREYTVPVTIGPYEQIQSTATGAFCDLNDTSSGIVLVEVVDGTPTFPIVYELFNATDLVNPVQTFSQTDATTTDYLFQNVSEGAYVIRVTTPCDSQDIDLDLIAAPLQPVVTADNPISCAPGGDVELSINLPVSLFEIVWTDDSGSTVGTGTPITVPVTSSTTITANYSFRPLFCPANPPATEAIFIEVLPDVMLVGTESASCNAAGTSYVLSVELSGTAPFTANGTGAPGTFTGNIWTSEPIAAGTDYSVDFQDVNGCNTLTLADVAPACCVFEVTCPTFSETTVACYDDLPSATRLTEAEFEALGNADGAIGDMPCGIIEITAANGPDTGSCSAATIVRTYTVTEYEDTNNNGIRDTGEDTVLNSLECTQNIIVHDTIPPSFVEMLPNDVTIGCDETIPDAPMLTAIDNCDSNVQVVFEEITTNTANCAIGYTITRMWTATDCSGNSSMHTQVITIPPTGPIMTDLDPEITMICGEEIPPVPDPVFTGGCGDYMVNFTEETILSGNTDDFIIERLWEVIDACDNVELFQQIITVVQPDREMVTIDICIEDDSVDLIGYLPPTFDTNGAFEIVSGNGTLNGSIFDPSDFGIGESQISYSATEGTCKYFVDFVIRINSDCVECNIASDIVVSKTVTANADGINDFFEIKGGEFCDYVFGVQIFNRWGQIVYESKDYGNDWGGFSPDNAFGSSSTLPSGTYYYIVTFPNQEIAPINGFIYLGAD
ncbi:MAG: gliding motility-associated C-terminal domain-containing protein [Bacteroidota bacterium]